MILWIIIGSILLAILIVTVVFIFCVPLDPEHDLHDKDDGFF